MRHAQLRPPLFVLLALASAFGCGADDPPSGRDPESDPTGTRGDGGADLAPECLAKGCDELGYECGVAVDNCGNPLQCDPPGGASPCAEPTVCGGDPDQPNKCAVCTPRADPCAAQGATCGTVTECGELVACGTCGGGALCLENRCSCVPQANPCGARVCGTASDGCGGVVHCGPTGGTCETGSCDAEGQCSCPPRAEVCAGRSGPVTVDGCSYQCGECVPDDADACAGAECGTARNNCGEVVRCGSAQGACAAGATCVGPQRLAEPRLPPQSASFQGGVCVPSNVARLLGKYATRTHAFRQAGTTSIGLLTRAESVALVDVRYEQAGGRVRLTERGCIGTGEGDPDDPLGRATRSWIPKYRVLPPVETEVSVVGDTFTRRDAVYPPLGNAQPWGWRPGVPSYCAGREGQEVDLPAGDPRRGQPWLPGDHCVCPTAAESSRLPRRAGPEPNNYATTALRDCRITDDDGDGKPGYTALGRALVIQSELYLASTGHGFWRGTVRDDRHHVGMAGVAGERVESIYLGCAEEGGACAQPGLDCGCPEPLQTVQFVPLADDAPLDCERYVRPGTDEANQTEIDRQFGLGFGSCSGSRPGQCPAGSICRSNRCFPQTSKGACASETCPDGDCEPCPTGTTCRGDGACWPTDAACPPRASSLGAACGA